MSIALCRKSYQEGFNARLAQLVTSVGIKQAATASKFRPFVDPLLRGQMKTLGERVYRDSRNPNVGVLRGLISSFLPGYDQLRATNHMRETYLRNMARIKQDMAMHPGSRPHAIRQIQELTKHYRANMGENFADIGATVQPRINAARNIGIGAGVAGAGAGGAMGGRAFGQMEGNQSHRAEMSNMPLMERLKFLVMPQKTTQAHRPWNPLQ